MSPFTSRTLRSAASALPFGALLLLLAVVDLPAQTSGTIAGTVVSDRDGSPLVGVTVSVETAQLAVQTDARGRFQLVGVPAGTHEVRARRLGFGEQTLSTSVAGGAAANLEFRLREQALLIPAVVVTATGETRRLAQTTTTVGVISSDALREARPTHPSAVMSQIPGVWLSTTGGEGHMMAIRQPQTTKPVYLFLEDGVPTRSTGFFNHNALYEVNLPQADRVEVLKGPATALFGSDAIGGVVNVETRRPSLAPSGEAYLEGGTFGYNRLLLSGSNTFGANGVRADVNLTRTGGWRDATAFDRQSVTLRGDSHLAGGASLKTVFTASRIDQQTAGSSSLPRDVYNSDPRVNYTPISLRDVRAVRFSSAFEKESEHSFMSVTPYLRWNDMELLPNWSLTFDPTLYTTGHSSAGVLVRARRDLAPIRTRLIGGVDFDHSPGSRIEHRIVPSRTGPIFTDYTLGDVIYDYDVTYQGISPYLQAEINPVEALHLSAGLRYDRVGYSYATRLAPIATGRWRRPADAELTYGHLSPKLGASFEVAPGLNVYGNYSHGFRAPSEGQLFRQGSGVNTIDLEPVTADSYETGARGEFFGRVGYSLALYRMTVKNDILNFRLPDGTPEAQNAGETLHHGVEAGLTLQLAPGLRGDVNYSRAEHTYRAWSPQPGVDYSGSEMESAPNDIFNARFSYAPSPLPGARFALEWNHIGGYWLNPQNTQRYEGHSLLNLHTSAALPHDLELVAKVMNVLDARYAETATHTQARGEELSPGLPRAVYLGLQYRWER